MPSTKECPPRALYQMQAAWLSYLRFVILVFPALLWGAPEEPRIELQWLDPGGRVVDLPWRATGRWVWKASPSEEGLSLPIYRVQIEYPSHVDLRSKDPQVRLLERNDWVRVLSIDTTAWMVTTRFTQKTLDGLPEDGGLAITLTTNTPVLLSADTCSSQRFSLIETRRPNDRFLFLGISCPKNVTESGLFVVHSGDVKWHAETEALFERVGDGWKWINWKRDSPASLRLVNSSGVEVASYEIVQSNKEDPPKSFPSPPDNLAYGTLPKAHSASISVLPMYHSYETPEAIISQSELKPFADLGLLIRQKRVWLETKLFGSLSTYGSSIDVKYSVSPPTKVAVGLGLQGMFLETPSRQVHSGLVPRLSIFWEGLVPKGSRPSFGMGLHLAPGPYGDVLSFSSIPVAVSANIGLGAIWGKRTDVTFRFQRLTFPNLVFTSFGMGLQGFL